MDPNYEKSLTTPSPDGPHFRPANALLIVVGIFVILAGLLLCAGGWLYGMKMPEFMMSGPGKTGSFPESMRGIFASVGVMLGATGLGLAILGAGSIALRKWARDLLLAFGWLLIAFAILFVLSMVMMIPQMMTMSQEMARAAGGPGGGVPGAPSMAWFMVIGIVISVVFYLLLIGGPGALLVLLYRAKNVELTTRYYHQAPCWTEKCHTSVLALWLMYALGIISLGSMFVGYIPLALEMKLVPSARVGYVFLSVMTVILAILAYGVSRAAPWSWWASVIYAVACAGLGYYYLHAFDWGVLSRMSMQGMPGGNEELTKIMERQQAASMKAGVYSGALTWMAWLVWLFLIRKHFGIGKSTGDRE